MKIVYTSSRQGLELVSFDFYVAICILSRCDSRLVLKKLQPEINPKQLKN